MARPMPVLPLVASITVWPGLSLPDRSASSITPRAKRSLTDPRGLNASIFTNRLTPSGANFPILTTGVSPTVSRILLYLGRIGSPPPRLGPRQKLTERQDGSFLTSDQRHRRLVQLN